MFIVYGFSGVGRFYVFGLFFLGVVGLDSGFRVSWVGVEIRYGFRDG